MGDRLDIAIVGAGPAGITAAVQLRRFGYDPVVFEAGRPGGLVVNANWIENYPGFPEGVSGVGLASKLADHLEQLGITVRGERVVRADRLNGRFALETAASTYEPGVLMLASGTAPNLPAVPWLSQEGISERIATEVFVLRGLEGASIVVVGAGDVALDSALSLSRRNRVTILARTQRVRALGLLVDRVRTHPHISFHKESVVESAQCSADGLQLQCRDRDGPFTLGCEHVLLATGRKPNLAYASDSIRQDLATDRDAKRLFWMGDVRRGDARQVAIAVGDGMLAAMRLHQGRQGR